MDAVESSPHNEILFSAKISRRSKFFSYVIIAILFISSMMIYLFYPNFAFFSMIFLVLGVLYLIIIEILLFRRRLCVTAQTISERAGLLKLNENTVDMEDIISIRITQGIFQRILGYGELHINTSEEKEEEEIIFTGLAKPRKVKSIIENILRKRSYRIPSGGRY